MLVDLNSIIFEKIDPYIGFLLDSLKNKEEKDLFLNDFKKPSPCILDNYKGVLIIDHFNPTAYFHHLIDTNCLDSCRNLFRIEKSYGYDDNYTEDVYSYGVCDTVDQLLSKYDFEGDDDHYILTFAPVYKKTQSPSDGWRWHRWGPYIGEYSPEYEYLYDEKDIDRVLVFNILRLKENS